MDNKQIMEAFEKACQDKEFREEFANLLSKYVPEEKKDLTDQELIRKFYDDDFDTEIPPYVAADLQPFDVVNGIYYNEEKDSFELYPFKVIRNNCTNLELLGLKILGADDWPSAKNKKFKFIFTMTDKDYFVAEGRIPDRDHLCYTKDMYNGPRCISNNYLIAIGAAYWTGTKTEDECGSSNAWRIRNDGRIDFDDTSCSYGIIPHVVIEFD